MFKHIALWALSESAKKKDKAELIGRMNDSIGALVGKVDGLVAAEVGCNQAKDGYEVVLYTVFESREAYEKYLVHPLHLAHRDRFFDDMSEKRLSGDYTI